jgi:hypothetical protein
LRRRGEKSCDAESSCHRPPYIHILVYIHTHIHIHTHTHTHTYIHTYKHTYIHTYIHMYVCMYVCMYVYLYICVCIYKCIHSCHHPLFPNMREASAHWCPSAPSNPPLPCHPLAGVLPRVHARLCRCRSNSEKIKKRKGCVWTKCLKEASSSSSGVSRQRKQREVAWFY